MIRHILPVLVAAGVFLAGAVLAQTPAANPKVLLKTSKGDIAIELYPDKAPLTVQNFLSYVDAKHYDGLIFHRVIAGFMIQTGGVTQRMGSKLTKPAIKNESGNGLKNARGAVAMARGDALDSATSQFYINLVDNFKLDSMNYCVFGKVVAGMEVVDSIGRVETGEVKGYKNAPLEPIVLLSAERVAGK